MLNNPDMPYVNKWGEEILGEHVEHAVSATDPMYNSEAVWQLQRVRAEDYEAREYGREFVLVRFNASRSQSFRTGEFTRETALALRDMLNAALTEDPASVSGEEEVMRDPVGMVRVSPDGLVSVQTSWSQEGENVRIIDPVTGTAGFQTEDYVAEWTQIGRRGEGSECRTVHLPTLLPTSGTYTIRTGQPIRIEPGFQEIEITISLPKGPNVKKAPSGELPIGGMGAQPRRGD